MFKLRGVAQFNNKTYCIFNEQYSKRDTRINQRNLSERESLDKVRRILDTLIKFSKKIRKCKNAVNSTGDDMEQVRNCKYIFLFWKRKIFVIPSLYLMAEQRIRLT